MKTSLPFLLSVSALSVCAAGCATPANQCAHVAEPPAARAPNGTMHAEKKAEAHAPISIDYKLQRGDTVLLSGQSDFDGPGSANIDQSLPHDMAERLRLSAREDQGRVTVAIEYTERTPEGRDLFWSPSLSLAPGVTGEVKLELGGGEARRIIVTARPTAKVGAAPTRDAISVR